MRFNPFKRAVHPPTAAAPAIPDQCNAYVDALALKSSDLGKSAAELNGLIGDLSTTGEEQIKLFAELARDIESMMRTNHAIFDATQHSKRSVDKTRRAVEEIGRSFLGVANTLADVTAAADNITEIALQTRLVAFNAAVEAGRAGSAGLGFGVVAEAVKDLATKVDETSRSISETVQQLDARISTLSRNILTADLEDATHRQESFQKSVSEIELGAEGIASSATINMDACAAVIDSVGDMSRRVASSAHAMKSASSKTEGFLLLAEALIELTVESGIKTADSPFIEKAIELAAEIGRAFEAGVGSNAISVDDLFSRTYKPIAGTIPKAYISRYSRFVDALLPAYCEDMMAFSPKVVFCVVTDEKGFVPVNVAAYYKPYSSDPVWNEAHCRHSRFFDGRTEMVAIRNRNKFLLQTYRRNMGDGKFVVMKHLSAPIWVDGKHWGALRIGLNF